MCRVIFKNPNVPEQPAQGVYRWYYVENGKEKISEEGTFYVGQAGAGRHGPVRRPSALGRGVGELQRDSFSSDQGHTLDADFIVGTAIMYLTSKGLDCVWEHICDDPGKERKLCRDLNPKLQDGNGRIRAQFKLRRDEAYWRNAGAERVKEAEECLYRLFRTALTQNNNQP